MNIIPESQQNQTVESNPGVQQQDDNENTLQDDDVIKPIQTKPIEEMDCVELKEFGISRINNPDSNIENASNGYFTKNYELFV